MTVVAPAGVASGVWVGMAHVAGEVLAGEVLAGEGCLAPHAARALVDARPRPASKACRRVIVFMPTTLPAPHCDRVREVWRFDQDFVAAPG